jgi:hypothetical protein
MTERVVLNERANQAYEPVSESDTQVVLAGERPSCFAADIFIEGRFLVVRWVKAIDFGGQGPIAQIGQKANSTAHLHQRKQF